jgi:cytochrome c peroxidase
LKKAALWVPLLGATLALAGCGTGGVVKNADLANGKTIFLQGKDGKPSCGTCHTLAAAGTFGKNGPNLDDAFMFARNAKAKGDRFQESTIANVVLDQIRFPSQGDFEAAYKMPENLVKGQDAMDVAAYVASVAGKK